MYSSKKRSVLVYQFVDYDSVADREHGKGRVLHNHNRDYKESDRQFKSVWIK